MAHTPSTTGDFTHQADAYAASRPGYPAEMLDTLIAHVGVQPGASVADIGAGTGIFTALLAEHGFAVSAVEPSGAMREHAPDLPGVEWIDGTFEHTALPDASQRWVVAAQSFHWADPPRALPELARILQPGGHLTVVWNDRDTDRSELLRETRRLVRELAPGFDELYRDREWADVLTSTGHFTDAVAHTIEHDVTMSPARYLMLWRSHNRLHAAVGPQAVDRLVTELACVVGDRDVVVPYRCIAFTARRA